MKRVWMILAISLWLFVLSACSRERTVGICLRHGDEYKTRQMQEGLEQAFAEQSCCVAVADAVGDQSRQNTQIQKMLVECDLLIVEPVMTAAATEVVQWAENAEVPVIFINYLPQDAALEQWERACYIGSDMTQPGILQSQLVRQLPDGGDRNGDGSVAYTVIGGPADHVDARLWSRDCGSSFVGRRLCMDYGDWSRTSGRRICRQQLMRYQDQIEVIFCNSDALAQGALEALETAEIPGGENIYLVGIGGDRQVLELIADGSMTGTVSPDTAALISRITQTGLALLEGNTPVKKQFLDFVIVKN